MQRDPEIDDVAAAVRLSVGLLSRRFRQTVGDGEPSWPERSALSRLDRIGPMTSAELAKLEQISPQSMGATLSALEERGLVGRQPDPEDGRRVVMSLTEAGLQVLKERRNAKVEQLARALDSDFTQADIQALRTAAPLIQRLAETI